jgi:hypothetical protein
MRHPRRQFQASSGKYVAETVGYRKRDKIKKAREAGS